MDLAASEIQTYKFPSATTTPPMICFVGYSGSGKTTVMEKLISELTGRGLKVGTIKHDVHGFEMDQPGKDSWRHKQAGASATIVTSPKSIGLVMDVEHDHQPEELLSFLSHLDIVLVEGFKRCRLPKIEIFRPEIGKPPASRGDEYLRAVFSDSDVSWGVPRFAVADIPALADFVVEMFGITSAASAVPRRATG
jgi:molybdopterin-guanine dinucleotide biosynthesis protein B